MKKSVIVLMLFLASVHLSPKGQERDPWEFLRFLEAVFEPQGKNPKGEIHEDIGIFSFDKWRKVFVLRSFYVEGFVNEYVFAPSSEAGESMEFVTESVENAPAGTRAKLVFRRLGDSEIEQSFHVAFPGREYSCYSKNILKINK